MKKSKIIFMILLIVSLVAIIGVLIGLAIHGTIKNKISKNPIVTLEVEGYGEIQIELYPDYAPNTVSTIIKLIQNGYYNGKVFYGTDSTAVHLGMMKNEISEETTEATETVDSTSQSNVIEDVRTVSDIDTSIISGSEKDYEISIKGEFIANGFEKNTLRFEKGTVGLYRATYTPYDNTDLTEQSRNSGNSLMFISIEENSSLNGLYTPFGKVINGFDIIEQISTLQTVVEENAEEGQIKYFENLPIITKATINTYGIDYGMPIYEKAFDYQEYYTNLFLQYYSY